MYTHTQFLPCSVHKVIAYFNATMSAEQSVMNAAQAFKLSTLLLFPAGLFVQSACYLDVGRV